MQLNLDQISKLIDIWNADANIHCELWEFLGWTLEDYTKWSKTPGNFRPDSNLDEAELDFIFNVRGKC